MASSFSSQQHNQTASSTTVPTKAQPDDLPRRIQPLPVRPGSARHQSPNSNTPVSGYHSSINNSHNPSSSLSFSRPSYSGGFGHGTQPPQGGVSSGTISGTPIASTGGGPPFSTMGGPTSPGSSKNAGTLNSPPGSGLSGADHTLFGKFALGGLPYVRKQLDKESMRSNMGFYNLGIGWKVDWAAWQDEGLSSTPAMDPQPKVADEERRDSTTSVGSSSGSGSKLLKINSIGYKKPSELMMDETSPRPKSDSESQLLIPSALSKQIDLLHSTLKDKLAILHSIDPAKDPIECAQAKIRVLAMSANTDENYFRLFSFVESSPVTPFSSGISGSPLTSDQKNTDKGKRKETTASSSTAPSFHPPDAGSGRMSLSKRMFWVFSITKGEMVERNQEYVVGKDVEEVPLLETLHLEGLTRTLSCLAAELGTLSHQTLFPSFYDCAAASEFSKDASPMIPNALKEYPPKATLLRSPYYPSAIDYTRTFTSLLPGRQSKNDAGPGVPPLSVKSVYEALVAGINELILVQMLQESQGATTSSTASGAEPYVDSASRQGGKPRKKVTRTNDALLLLAPGPSRPFPSNGRIAVADGVKAKFRPNLMKDKIMIQSSVRDVALRTFPNPANVSLLLPMTPLLMVPYQVEGYFIKVAFASDQGPSPALLEEIRARWSNMLQGTGLRLQNEETWVTCRIESKSTRSCVPDSATLGSKSAYNADDSIDVIWPSSLCLLDGDRVQPKQSTTPKAKASDLPDLKKSGPDGDTLASTTAETPPNLDTLLSPSSIISRPLGFDLRRRFASVLQHRHEIPLPFRDPIISNAEGSAVLVEELIKRQEEREKRETIAQIAQQNQHNQTAVFAPFAGGKAVGVISSPGAAMVASGDAKSTGFTHHSIMAGAPINMRTPISLEGSSTEAPSPADGFAPLDKMSTSGSISLVNEEGLASSMVPFRQQTNSDVYPSPSDAQANLSNIGEPQSSTFAEQPMENAFPDFDWGDDFTSVAIGSNLPQDFDDGMMMGLTDDDFSYFDEPIPQGTNQSSASREIMHSSSGIPFGHLQSAGPSSKFVDHFSHLSATTPFASAASPNSPFGQHVAGSPHFPNVDQSAASFPSILAHSYDVMNTSGGSGNSLIFGSTPGVESGTQDGSPYKTPRTPYTPFVELMDEDEESPASASALFSSSLSIDGLPGAALLPVPSHHQGSFDPIPFGSSHAQTDEKYDWRKGKFGLPSPESEHMQELTPGINDMSSPLLRQSRQFASAPWYSVVCNPKLTVAWALKKKKRINQLSAHKRHAIFNKATLDRLAAPRSRRRSWQTANVLSVSPRDDETSEDDVDTEEDMDDEMLRPHDSFIPKANLQKSKNVLALLGAPLLLLRHALSAVLKDEPVSLAILETSVVVPSVPVNATVPAESALETTISLLADQFIYNASYRAHILESRISNLAATATDKQVSALALRLVDDRLSRFCGVAAVSESNETLKKAMDVPLQIQSPPRILFRAQHTVMQASTSATTFWRPMGFEPLAGGKDVSAFVVYEEGGDELSASVKRWLSDVSDAYQSSRLGKHTIGQAGHIEDGLAAIPTGSLMQSRVREELRSFCSVLTEATKSKKHVVLYLLTPPESLSMSSTNQLVLTLQQLLRCRTGTMSMAVYPLPISILSRHETSAINESHSSRFDKLAFSVYDQLLVPVTKLRCPTPETFPSAAQLVNSGANVRLFQCPAVTLSPTRPLRVNFELHWPPSSLEVINRHRLLHVGYTCEPARVKGDVEWIIVSCIDEKGEIWKTLPRLVRAPPNVSHETSRARAVWTITKMLAETADVEWRVIVTRIGLMPEAEVKAWDLLLREQLVPYKRPLHVTVTCTDFDPPMSILEAKRDPTPSPWSSTSLDPARGVESSRCNVVALPTSKSPYLQSEPSHYAITPLEPIAVHHIPTLIAFCTTYLIHVPRIASLTHSIVDPFITTSSTLSPISVYAIHFLLMQGSRHSSLAVRQIEHINDVRQSFVELAALGQIRWGSSGKVAWHLEAVAAVAELIRTEDQSR